MLIFGHAGITLGAAMLLKGLTTRGEKGDNPVARSRNPSHSNSKADYYENKKKSWIESIIDHADIRILLIGSLLPDVIDKPMGQVFFRETFSNGRIFSHSLLFLAIIAIIGLYLYRSRSQTWLLVLSFGTLTHLFLDQMWRDTHTLLWPVYGFAFERSDLTDWALNILFALFREPELYISELVGLAIMFLFLYSLFRRRRVFAFFKSGKF